MIPHSTRIIADMKKILTYMALVVLTALFAFSLAGCSGQNASTSAAASSATASSVAVSPATSASSAGSATSASTASASGDSQAGSSTSAAASGASDITVEENGEYSDKDHVALYIHTYGKLPSNYISKTKARKAGWVSSKGNLWDVLPGKSIGGSRFYNDDGALPDASGRDWTECDIDYEGGFRGAKRIVFSNDGLVFYTDDHYKTFQQLY